MLAAEVALRFLEDLAALLARVDGALDAGSLAASEQLAHRFGASFGEISTGRAIRRFRFGDFFSRMWLE